MAKREIVVELQLTSPDAVAELGKLEADTKKYQRALKDLYAEIKKGGGDASRSQQEAVGVLSAAIRRNQSVIRELRNDLSGATAAGLRFRDKMAEASRAGLAEFGLQAVTIAGVATAVAGLTKELFKLSGEIEKVDARNRAIAQESLPAFTRAAELNANALGLTQRQYVSLAADQALRLKNLGLEGAIVEELALQTVEYADKLGDFSGGQLDTEQAAKLLNDALTGQTKGLKELGINVKASKDEIEAQAQELMRSKGLTEEQATAVATLQLAFRDTGDTLKVFGDQLLGLDAAQDAATAKLEEAKESLAQGLTPAFILATESVAGLTDELNRLVSGDGIIAKAQGLVDIIGRLNPAGLIAGFLGENVFAETTKEINDLETATAAYNTALRIGNEELIAKTEANLKAVRALTGETLTAKAVQDSVTQSEAAQAEATDKTTKATEKKAEAVRKLTAEQLARIDAENAIRSDARENIFAQTGSGTETPAVQLQREEQVELDQIAEQAIANRDALREDARIREIRGITDLNAERALLESEWQTGSIASYEEYLARKDNLRRAEVENEMMAAAAISDLFGTIAAAYDKDSAEFKIFATAQALISTYLAANKALASAPPPYNYALVAATVAAGLANVAKIQGFEEGGFTSKRSRDDAPVGVVHANEYVVPAPLLRTPKGKRLVDELERMRLGHPVRYAAPYISGGSTVRFMRGTGLAPVGVSSSDIRSADLTRALTMMPTPVVRVDEINRVQRRVNVIDSLSTA